jgi:hypothetical protein
MHLLGFSKTAWDKRICPDTGKSPGLSLCGFGFVVLGDEPRVLNIKDIFQA